MFTRSMGKAQSSDPAAPNGDKVVEPVQPSVAEQQRSHSSRAPTVPSSKSSRSSATLKARKATAEALALRHRLELAARERERDRELATLQQQLQDCELRAELAAIDADAAESSGSNSRVSHRSSTRVSVDRTKHWVEKLENEQALVNNGISAEECEHPLVPSPARMAPPTSTRAAAPLINSRNRQQQADHPEAAVLAPPLNHNLFQAVADTAAAAKALAQAHSTKKVELGSFSGNSTEWLHFKRVYDNSKQNFSALENISRLQNALRGPARDAVATMLLSAENPEDIMRALEDNFARPELIVFKEVNSLRNLPRLGNDLKELGVFSNRVRNSISIIKLLKQVEYLHSPELFHTVLGKLNPTTKIRWTDFAMTDMSGRPKLEILSDFLIRELNQYIKFGLSPESNTSQQQHLASDKLHKRENVHSTNTQLAKGDDTQKECCFCKKNHNIKECKNFKSLSVAERWNWLREAKICYRCLKRASHQWKTCKVKPCAVDGCTLRHHPLLHQNSPPALINSTNVQTADNVDRNFQPLSLVTQSDDDKVVVSTTSTDSEQPSTISTLRPRCYLKILPVTVSGPAGSCDVYALLDDGSTATLIDASIAEQIGATGPQQTITVHGVGGLERTCSVSYVDFHIKGKNTHDSFFVKNARAMHSLSLNPQTIIRETIQSLPHLVDLDEILTYENATPTVLIGADHWHLSINLDVRAGRKSEPVACLTALGWTLYGVSSSKTKLIDFVNHATFSSPANDNIEFLVKEQYKLDSLGISKTETPHCKRDQRAIEILESTTKRLPSGRFEVGLPWRDDIRRIPDSYPQAMSRFLSLERRMAKDKDFAKAYEVFMSNMVEKDYAEECASETYYAGRGDRKTDRNIRFYLPHFGVYHPQKRKLRVVHDAAAMNDGVSLNSLLLPGPDLLQSLLKILFRFREGRVALAADIREMFPQVRIREEDRDALRFLWRPNRSQPIKEFRMTAVIFGACCSPFIAQYVKNKNAEEYAHSHPKAVDAILSSHYMDDYIDSQDDATEASQLAADIIYVHSGACFEMRAWISNEPTALKLVPEELRAMPSEIDLGSNPSNVRALGIAWQPLTDLLGFRTGLGDSIPQPLTKRKVLSHLMRIYDPLGLLGPVIINGRILFQQAWRSNIGWDTEFPANEATRWIEWFQAVANVAPIKIPRWYASSLNSEPLHRELHVFADASEHAYACVAYWRLIYEDSSIRLVLISSKARVSPLKPTSIPRLELQAALIASRLALTITDSHKKKPSRTYFWTDSMTVLGWLRSDARTFKPFVAHRIGEIIENSNVADWKWVPTDLNVADDATRPRHIELSTSSRWFAGPSFLFKSPEDWPQEPSGLTPVREELKSTELVGLLTTAQTLTDWPLEPSNMPPTREELKSQTREMVGLTTTVVGLPTPVTANFDCFSDWTRLLRATARVHQAVAKFRNLLASHPNSKSYRQAKSACPSTSSTILDPLDAELIRTAETHILQRTQLESFPAEFHNVLNSKAIPSTSRIAKLSPRVGDDKLLHLDGRIKAVEDVDPDTRSPILLDGGHRVVRMLVQFYHRRVGHANHESVVNELRQRFWLLKLRVTVRNVARQCLLCRFRKAQPMNPAMGDLPRQRLAHHQRPFTFTGVDYFGPVTVTIGRRHEKRYVALFTCLTTRAMHLEMVHSLTADSAIMGLRRFIARRGTPNTIFSDNGTAFVGANRILKDFYSTDVLEFAATRSIKWNFIPAAAPHFGGCWERLVRTVKVALQATLKERNPKEETLRTVLAEAEAIVNSRPLSHVSTDPDDPTTLTPFHFLLGTSSNQQLPGTLDDSDLAGRAEWRKALRLADHFWNRWVREVLPTMQPRQQNQDVEIKLDDVVVIVDGTLPRGSWPRGRVVKLYPGKDGVTRVVDVATAGGVLRRPSKKLVRITR